MVRRHIQVEQEIAHMAGEFLARESNTHALLTVTRAELTDDLKKAVVFLSVLPEKEEAISLKLVKRLRSDLREYVRKHSVLHPIPFLEFEIDYGEKNRQRVDELTRKKT